MKAYLPFVAAMLLCASCRKDQQQNEYFAFNDNELRFVNYTQGQSLRLMDTVGVVHNMLQDHYQHGFVFYEGGNEAVDGAAATGYYEKYQVSYHSTTDTSLKLSVHTEKRRGLSIGSLLQIGHYFVSLNANGIMPATFTLTVNGVTYPDVRSFTARRSNNYNDTATLFHSRQMGIIQLLYPNGKAIARVP